jgi:Cof subfamily protein (haloacid dehalogenase superfamily)
MSDQPPIKMIATDIDGTMLRSDGTLSGRVRDALHEARRAGLHVVPATGRPVAIAADVIDAAELRDYWVFANGAVTRHLGRDELVRGFWMDPGLTQALLSRLRHALPGAGFALELEDSVAFEDGFEKVVPVVPDQGQVDDVMTLLDGEGIGRVQKILVYDLSQDLDALFGRVSDVVGPDAVPSYSGLRFVELAAGLVTKAMALDLLAADLGIAAEQVAAFGDNHNDLPMLQWAGRSFAMANATDDAKETADEVIGHNDADGLADKIEQLLEGNG